MQSLFKLTLSLLATILLTSAAFAQGLEVGDTAPDFKLKNIDGKMVSLSDYPDAKGFVITFTCNTCPFAVMYEDRFVELHNKYAKRGYPVIAINPNDPEVKVGDNFAAMKARAKEKNFPFAYVLDEGQKVYPQFGATRTPHIYVLDANRTVQYIGALDDNAQDATQVTERYVENAIAKLVAGQKPDPAMTKAIGCTIKVKR
ncbi:MAG: thioredoxin family protein [Saprospiraceae bacterium]